jgi:hypothetical protein
MREQHVSPFDEGEAAIDLAYLHSGYDTRNVDFAGHPAIPAPIVGVAKRVVQRLLSAALQPQVSYNAANTRVVTHIKDWLAALHRDSLGELRAVKEQMLALGQRLDQIEAQLEEQATAKDKTAHPVPTTELAVDYRLFEDRFRGSEADLTERQRSYVQAFVGRNNILDIGCGKVASWHAAWTSAPPWSSGRSARALTWSRPTPLPTSTRFPMTRSAASSLRRSSNIFLPAA